jgi:F-type H+-transporting ATPase subunit 8
MPQLIPFYFINQITFGYLFLIIIIWFLSKWILPAIPLTALARMSVFNPKKRIKA